ncbi:MAG: hypothetical protein H6851_12815 [Geminicoccaceae bacterium]|nr:hypothetical protein [Geminicoccaceae bacterium]MCB9944486.1 hypothetical protein [Geminicoccaceae bacterium]
MASWRVQSKLQPERWLRVCSVAMLGTLTGCAEQKVDLSTYLAPGDTGWDSAWNSSAPPVLEENIQLIGMDASNVVALFGKPSLQQRESEAQYWRYSFGDCVVDIYVFKDDHDKRDEVVHYDVRDHMRAPRGIRGGQANSCASLEKHLVRAPDFTGDKRQRRIETH